MSFDLSYVEVDRDDGGRVEEIDLYGRYGRMLTDAHEVGFELSYTQEGQFDGTEHAGAAFGVSYFWLQGTGSAADAEQLALFGSLRVKF